MRSYVVRVEKLMTSMVSLRKLLCAMFYSHTVSRPPFPFKWQIIASELSNLCRRRLNIHANKRVAQMHRCRSRDNRNCGNIRMTQKFGSDREKCQNRIIQMSHRNCLSCTDALTYLHNLCVRMLSRDVHFADSISLDPASVRILRHA